MLQRRKQQQQQTSSFEEDDRILPTTTKRRKNVIKKTPGRREIRKFVVKIILFIGILFLLKEVFFTTKDESTKKTTTTPMTIYRNNHHLREDNNNNVEQEEEVLKTLNEKNEKSNVDEISVTNDDEKEKEQKNPKGIEEESDSNNILALLYPPGLIGGYRNQVLRFLSLVVKAYHMKKTSLLLPSLLWSTQITINTTYDTWIPIPHDLIFDVEYWNDYVSNHSTTTNLPTLVDVPPNNNDFCWTTNIPNNDNENENEDTFNHPLVSEVLHRGFLKPIVNLSSSLVKRTYVTNTRRLDLLSNVTKECNKNHPPEVYGGGKMIGRLWKDYKNYVVQENKKPPKGFYGMDADLLKALQPKKQWKELAYSCITDHISTSSSGNNNNQKNYIALHARMELEMMNHVCGKHMERNMTSLFTNVQSLLDDGKLNTTDIDGIFVAVSRSGLELNHGRWYENVKEYADDNLRTFNRIVGNGHDGSVGEGLKRKNKKDNTVVFECGEKLMSKYYVSSGDYDHGSLLQSVINFYIATEAYAFIGVRGSSYSTDIWTTRYHQGKGKQNYEYTKNNGIVPLNNNGLPPKHTDCKR